MSIDEKKPAVAGNMEEKTDKNIEENINEEIDGNIEEKIEELRLILNKLPVSSFSGEKMLELSRRLDQHIFDYQRFKWNEIKK